jgi:hypothetical protein
MRKFAGILATIAWFAVIVQYVIMLRISTDTIIETTIRFFSFFTILTNLMVALWFSAYAFQRSSTSNIITVRNQYALTVYIAVVGIVYQVALRHLWKPQGMQFLVDELLHTIIPLLVIVFWFFTASGAKLKYGSIFQWLWYPAIYFGYVLFRGKLSGEYPYPFVNVGEIGIRQVLLNAGLMLLFFLLLSAILVFIGARRSNLTR